MSKRLRWLLSNEVSAAFGGTLAVIMVATGHPWFGIAWAWLSGSQFTLAAWLREERRERDKRDDALLR